MTRQTHNEKGSALLFAVIISILLMALGLSLTLTSMSEFSMSDEFSAHETAILVADAGLNASQTRLRGKDLSYLLQSTVTVPTYTGIPPESNRNPISKIEARSTDYERLPSPVGTLSLSGLLTPAAGVPLDRGRYFSRISDNDDGDGNPGEDSDGRVYVRTVGVHPGSPQELRIFGSRVNNSVVIVERMLKRDMSLDVSTPFSVYGPSVDLSMGNLFDGNSFKIDGWDHSHLTVDQILRGGHSHTGDAEDHAAIGVIYDNPTSSDANTSLQQIIGAIDPQQQDNLVGASGPLGAEPSVRDDTNLIRNSGNEDSINVFDANFMARLVRWITAGADYRYDQDTTLSGSNIVLGTDADPKITVAMGDLTLAGNGSGSGVLLVKGSLNYNGAFNFNGLILVLGEGSIEVGGANKAIIGGVYVAKLLNDGSGNYSFGSPSFSLSGNSNFYFRSDSVKMAVTLFPMKSISWREIVEEISIPGNTSY